MGCKAAFTCPKCYAQSVTHLKANQVKIISQNLVLKKGIIFIESKWNDQVLQVLVRPPPPPMVFVEQNSSADQRDLIDRLDQQAKGSSIQGGVYTHSHLSVAFDWLEHLQ